MKNFFQRSLQTPHFLYLLPFFFVFHGYAQNPEAITPVDFFALLAKYLLAAGLLLLAGWILFRQWQKAAVFAFGILFLHLFFGAFHDGLKALSPGFFLAKYSVLLPLLILLLILFLYYLKKTRQTFLRFFAYLNLLLLVLVLLELPQLAQHKRNSLTFSPLPKCDTCSKPDVYLIIADEYADSTSLANIFQFNNGSFQRELRQRGFYLAQSVSNYNFTPFAMASLLTMDYVKGLEGRNSSYGDRLTCASLINKNRVWDFFEKTGYEIRNNSIYRVANVPTVTPQSHFRIGTDFIASHTLLSRLKQDLGYHLFSSLKIKSVIDDYVFYLQRTNQRLVERLKSDVKEKAGKPRVVYTHIHMPHHPYYYKANGSANNEAGNPENAFDKEAYIGYLQYSNRFYLQLIDNILQESKKPPVIMFMGDHGFREFQNPTAAEKKAYFMNLNAVYLPTGDYSRFYTGISGVNQFRVILNTIFGQQLPMLKDSTSFLQE